MGKTDGHLSKFERQRQNEETSDDAFEEGTGDREDPENRPRYVPLGRLVELRREATAGIGKGRGNAGREPAPAGAAEHPARSGARSARAPDLTEQREQLRAYLADFARELGDEAPLAASVTRALNTFAAAGVHPAQWGDVLYQARSITQEHTAQITKQATDGARIRRKNKMPYFFSVLEQLVGLRPGPSSQPHLGDGDG